MNFYFKLSFSMLITIVVFLITLLQNVEMHWYLIPLFISSLILCYDSLSLFSKGGDLFQPKPLIALFGINFFVIAPIIFLNDDNLTFKSQYLIDWEHWVGILGVINLIGLIVYKISYIMLRNRKKISKSEKKTYQIWSINSKKLMWVGSLFLIISLILQIYIYMKMGGINSFVDNYAQRTGAFSNFGWIFMISESFPIIMILMICVYLNNKGVKLKTWQVFLLLGVYFLIRLYFGGLRGSRSNVIWGVIWGAGIINYTLYKFKRKDLILGITLILLFTFTYGFYKADSQQFLDVVRGYEGVESLMGDSEESFNHMLVGDLSRAHVQALILNRTMQSNSYEYAYGETYLSSLNILVPDSLELLDLNGKTHFGAKLLFGADHVELTNDQTTRIFGLVGESLLNFGLIFILPLFVLLAFIVNFIERKRETWIKNEDSRLAIYPMLVITTFLILVQDSDNLVFTLMKNLTIPILLLFIVSTKKNIRTR